VHYNARVRTIVPILNALCLAILLAGCAPSGQYDPQVRRQQLLALYPPGQTTRHDVQQSFQPSNARASETRPPAGWEQCPTPALRARALASEKRTGQPVHHVDCYLAPDGFLGLCNCWFYYDANDVVTDAEWQYHTD
jgi:hypothetical protein